MAEFLASYIAISVAMYLMVQVGEKDGRRKDDQLTLTSAELQRTDKGMFGPGRSTSAPVLIPMVEIFLPLTGDGHDRRALAIDNRAEYSGDFKERHCRHV